MEAEECYFCGRTKSEAKLIHAIHTNEVITLCEECAAKETIPIIRKPTFSQLNESEKPYSIRQRLSSMAGFKEEKDYSSQIKERLDNMRKLKEHEEIKKISYIQKANHPLNLIENFHWRIMMERKKKKIDRKQLAEAIGESESALKIIESGETPDDTLRVINKIEQYLGIKLRKNAEQTFEIESKTNLETKEKPSTILKIDREKLSNITIADLVKLKKQKEELKNSNITDNENEEEKIGQETKKQGFFDKAKSWFSNNKKEVDEEDSEENNKEE